MSYFSKNSIIRSVVALALTVCVVLTGGCVSVTIREKPTQPTAVVPENTEEVTTQQPIIETFPTEENGETQSFVYPDELVMPSVTEPSTEAADIEINWDNMQVIEKDPNVLTEEELSQMYEENPQMADLMEVFGPYIDIFGFAYDAEQDIFYSTQYPVQRIFGYNTLYDSGSSPFGMHYLTQRIRFNYEGKEWMVQLWKGQYGATVGGEVGVYYRDADAFFKHYEAVADEDMVMMGFQLCKNDIPYLERGPEKHWWLTGFRILDVAVPTQLSMVIYFDWESMPMSEAFELGLKKMFLTDVTYVRDGTRFWLTWTL